MISLSGLCFCSPEAIFNSFKKSPFVYMVKVTFIMKLSLRSPFINANLVILSLSPVFIFTPFRQIESIDGPVSVHEM